MLELQVPDHVHYRLEPRGGAVMIDSSAGTWFALNSSAGSLFRGWARSGDFEDGIALCATLHPDVPPTVIRHDAEELLSELVGNDLLRVRPGVAAVMAVPERLSPRAPGTWPKRVLAHVCLAWAAVLVHVSFPLSYALVRLTRRRWCDRPLSHTQATEIVSAVGAAAQHHWGRAACLERSLAAVLMAAVARRRLDWCLGSMPDPYRFHAWVESGGRAVDDPREEPANVPYQCVLRV